MSITGTSNNYHQEETGHLLDKQERERRNTGTRSYCTTINGKDDEALTFGVIHSWAFMQTNCHVCSLSRSLSQSFACSRSGGRMRVIISEALVDANSLRNHP